MQLYTALYAVVFMLVLYARVYNEGGRGNSFSSIIPMAVNDYIVFGCDQNVYLQNNWILILLVG